jgi:hypothetical protein
MFVDHVRCLHNQIQTVLKMCSIKKIYIQIYDTESEQGLSNGRIIVNVIYILASCDQTRPYWYTQLRFLLDRLSSLGDCKQ